jgi:hypothetical protein
MLYRLYLPKLTMKMVREFGGPEVLTYDDWIENFHAAPELKERLDPLAVPDPITLNGEGKIFRTHWETSKYRYFLNMFPSTNFGIPFSGVLGACRACSTFWWTHRGDGDT